MDVEYLDDAILTELSPCGVLSDPSVTVPTAQTPPLPVAPAHLPSTHLAREASEIESQQPQRRSRRRHSGLKNLFSQKITLNPLT
jgi:hypothetical protein